MRITLTVTAGPLEGQTFTFEDHQAFIAGRSKHAHLRLPTADRFCSRVHFLVEVNPPECRLVDMGSNNGTYVNDRRVELTRELRHGDKIRAGRNVLRVEFENDPPVLPVDPILDTPLRKSASDTVVEEAAPPATLEVPGYDLLRELGRGAMGVVYLGRSRATGAQVAIKTIIPNVQGSSRQVERFLREANILRELVHPNIVAFREMGNANGVLYFVMDYVPGRNGSQILKERGPLPVPQAIDWISQLLQALDFAHGRGFVHRDLKPSNLMVTTLSSGGLMPPEEIVKLADFGLARVYQTSQLSGLTLFGSVGGTPAYMAPEQIIHFREARPAADQYSAAATLYKLLTGHYIHDPTTDLQLMFAQILEQDAVPIRSRRADIPEGLAQVIHKALARDPARRFVDVEAFRAALAPFRTARG